MSLLEHRWTRPLLEVGNVLSHYGITGHDVIDKYEQESGVINCDVTEYETGKRYDTIISISTIEHVGFDEAVRDSTKPHKAINLLRALLSPSGLMVVTAPTGYNPAIDEDIRAGRFGFDRVISLRRDTFARWREATVSDTLRCQYGKPYPCGNGLLIGIIGQ